jgi:small subunit ribosomal protein S8|tara:strand:+ start:2381 stop:2779 length:399 start_codon:yes stop_codon:yes gene_type:complete
MSDPIADMLTRIRNAATSRHEKVDIPSSKLKVAIAGVLKDEGFIRDYEISTEEDAVQSDLSVRLSYDSSNKPVITGLKRVSRPGLRVYVQRREVPRVFGGLGVAILSTSQGIMTGQEARRRQVGGEILCYVW